MKDVYIFGSSSLAYKIYDYIRTDSQYRFLGFTLNGEYCNSKKIYGHPLVPFEEISDKGGWFGVINCIGYSKAFSVRQKVDNIIKEKSVPLLSYIHESADIAYDVELGESCLVMKNSVIMLSVKMGDGNIISGASIGHDAVAGDYNWFGYSSVCSGYVKIKGCCFIGVNSTIKNNVTLAEYTTVGAASYVSHDTVKYEVLSPAKTVSLKFNKPYYIK
ncbi:MAG: acetyltransferase [Eubacterium sp.]|jgi:UDP-3-O-[3-hydroxymyristoyl] glucosamine N-acyltransferase|nr:acetyltransferase [Eubacterium sp.]